MSAVTVAGLAIVIGTFALCGFAWLALIGSEARRERTRLRARARASRAHYAAIEAAEDDPSFAPDVIEQSVRDAIARADQLWRGAPLAVLDGRADAGLLKAWARSRQLWIGSGLTLRRFPSIDLLRVVNREGDDEDRAVVRVRMHVHCRRPRLGAAGLRNQRLDERWTLGRAGDGWAVLSVDGDPLAGPVLTAPLIPNRSFDDDRLLEESLAEQASAQTVTGDVTLSELVSPDEPPALAVLDLSIVDARFFPPLIAAALAHLVEAWQEAVTGSATPLEERASAEAIAVLLRPGPGWRLFLRDAVLTSWEPTGLQLSRRPPAIEIELRVDAVRFVATDDDDRRFGNETERRGILLTWLLELSDSATTPWRLATSTNPADEIPGWS